MRKLTTEEYVNRAMAVHSGMYSYDRVVYSGANSKVLIGCSIHGYYKQRASTHLEGRGCPDCAKNVTRQNIKRLQKLSSSKRRMSLDTFVAKSNVVHGSKYSYDKACYINTTTPVTIVCPVHGLFEQQPKHHLRGCGCPVCSTQTTATIKTTNAKNQFVTKAMNKHGNKYDYSKVQYTSARAKVSIVCPQHGEFTQTPNSHLTGAGCPLCGRLGGFTHKFFQTYPEMKNKPAILYLIEFNVNYTPILKIGVTTRTIDQRFGSEHIEFDILQQIRLPLYQAFLAEQYFINHVITKNDKASKVAKGLNGYTECFLKNPKTLLLSTQYFSSIIADKSHKGDTYNDS